MKRTRAVFALLLAASLPVRAETTSDPLWTLLSSAVLPADEAAPDGEGDAKGLAGLQADLQLLSEGLESFRDEEQVKASLTRLEPRIAPPLRPFFRDRATSLRTVYRTLAVVDYTWASRLPEPPCAPVEARRALLSDGDRLFQTEKGESAPWLVSLLGPSAAGKSAEAALDRASARKRLSEADYARRRAQIRRLTLALASDKAVGAARSRLYCSRAAAFEDLAATLASGESLSLASRSAGPAPEASVFLVGRSAATLLRAGERLVLLTDARAVDGMDEARVLSADKKELAAKVLRRDAALGLALLSFSGDPKTPALVLAKDNPAKNDLVAAIGHSAIAGRWTKTSGLVVKSGAVSFQTDAAISADFTGGPVLDAAGLVAGVLVARPADTEEGFWPVAVPATAVARWLDGPVELTAAPEMIETAGTAAILTRAGPSGLTETGLGNDAGWHLGRLPPAPPTPPSVCVSRCGGGSSARPSSGYSRSYSSPSSSYDSGSAELGQALGQLGAQLILKGIPALFRGIGKLFSKKPKASAADQLVDNRHYSQPAQAPQPPPDPLKPSSLSLSVSRPSLAQGEDVEAVATVGFTGKDGGVSGHTVSFTVVPGGKLSCPPGTTDTGGIARVKCQAVIVEGDRIFDGLQDEERRRRGLRVPERVKRRPGKNDPIATLKERAEGAQDKLVIEEEKHPVTGTDTPGLDKTFNTGEPEEYVIKGDRVTLSASLLGLMDKLMLDVMQRPCAGAIEQKGKPGELECRPGFGGGEKPLSDGTWHSEAPEPAKPESGEKVPPKTVADLENFQPTITDERLKHILYGDKTGGGHRHGANKPGKTEFPEGWGDSKIKDNIVSVVTDPASTVSGARDDRIKVVGVREGVSIEVIVEGPGPDYGEVVTAYPNNLPPNPRVNK